jgi:hypothetical protein
METESGPLVKKAAVALKAAGAREVRLFGSARKGSCRGWDNPTVSQEARLP